ncbi:restriction endonuclease subunit S [Acidithiobacillus ferridurans]|uniref:restriction endonuclease subunit S n=1 Tax=Acidithiobacillus ferridurans TaxID=1232575 RepID=UPI001C069E3B|nr:restriction endonuclease subunit S [Acidithiobacillus ferridurans]MBU2804983.1 restriction endonuclease subunit S [Acidithiobacillus ferridurans]
MKQAKLKDLFDYLPKSKVQAGDGLVEGMYPFYTSSENQTKYLNAYQHAPGCLVFGTGGKASVHFTTSHFSTSTDCITIKPKPEAEIDAGYAFQYFKGNMQVLESGFKGAGLKHISKAYLSDITIPYPEEIDDQRRIAYLLGKVEGLIAQRKQHLQQCDDLLKSVFLEMFGDPVRNEKGWDIHPCEKAVFDISSGTSYGGEDRAFASPDEVGVLKISAVTKGTFDPTEFKVVNPAQITKAVRFVKRGDFLFSRANTVELVAACCIVPHDYNQLFLPDKLWVLTLNTELINAQFFNYLLKNERYRDVVRSLASGGHDSMLNISMKKFMTIDVPCPPVRIQKNFSAVVEKIDGIKSRYQQSLTDLEALYGALSQQAFKGELDLSRVPMPGIQTEEEKTVAAEPLHTPAEQGLAINLPDTDNLLAALESAEAREGMISQWLEAHCGQLGSTPFSVQHFMAAAQTRLAELHPDNDFELGANDYEHIKAWVFEALAAGTLSQAFDDAGNRIQLKAVQA